jgi:phosphohistidine phosphatase
VVVEREEGGLVNSLILMRHGKSSWETDLPDHQRPLAPRGRRDAVAAGRELAARSVRPNLVLCSTAVRTRQTWERVQAGGLEADQVEYADDVYQASLEELLGLVHQVHDQVGTLMMIGHAPGVPALAADLVGSDALDPDDFATSAIALIDVDEPWSSLSRGRLRDFLVPRG